MVSPLRIFKHDMIILFGTKHSNANSTMGLQPIAAKTPESGTWASNAHLSASQVRLPGCSVDAQAAQQVLGGFGRLAGVAISRVQC